MQTKIDWLQIADRISWVKKPTLAGQFSFEKPVSIKWFEDGQLNVSVNCIDRHLPKKAKTVALIWEPDSPAEEAKKITYQQLSDEVNRFANVLKKNKTVSIVLLIQRKIRNVRCNGIVEGEHTYFILHKPRERHGIYPFHHFSFVRGNKNCPKFSRFER